MPRFLFHTNNPLALPDAAEMEFETVRDAKCEAVRYAGQLMCDAAEHFWDEADFEMTVTDEKGMILFTMRVIGTEAPAIRSTARPR